MNKTRQKRNDYDAEIIKILIEKYQVGKNYIEKSIRGDRNGNLSITIAEAYKKLKQDKNKAIKKASEEL